MLTYKQNYPIITPQESGFFTTLTNTYQFGFIVQNTKGIPLNRGTNTVNIIDNRANNSFLCEVDICSTGGRGGTKTKGT